MNVVALVVPFLKEGRWYLTRGGSTMGPLMSCDPQTHAGRTFRDPSSELLRWFPDGRRLRTTIDVLDLVQETPKPEGRPPMARTLEDAKHLLEDGYNMVLCVRPPRSEYVCNVRQAEIFYA